MTSDKIIPPGKALIMIRKYCAYQERCQQEVRDKLYEMGQAPATVENHITHLIEENFLNEERFSRAYARGKFNIKQWGRVKIKAELKRRKISDYCIRAAMKEIDNKDYEAVLEKILRKKLKESKGTLRAKQYKVAQYAISRGFEPTLVYDKLNMIV